MKSRPRSIRFWPRPPPDALPDTVAEVADAVAEAADAVAEGTRAARVSADPSDGALDMNPDAESASAQTSSPNCESAKNADVVVVWRPDHRRIALNRARPGKQPRSGTPGRLDTDGHGSDPTPKQARKAAERFPVNLNPPDRAHADEKRRQRTRDYDMPRSNPTPAPQHKAKVDPNSPFAKLLELRPLLEEQANKRS